MVAVRCPSGSGGVEGYNAHHASHCRHDSESYTVNHYPTRTEYGGKIIRKVRVSLSAVSLSMVAVLQGDDPQVVTTFTSPRQEVVPGTGAGIRPALSHFYLK
ncbi:hypothetical protein E2C01_007109 [Portunus trituberculatus]|uniref:Uncharacterized protein n=1 Tax=Portunus trituberculatus TaxID=210409 RepID=A0A5B7D1I2_PORTR|nr:hypothetical protein [Portunus trituberculatus]